MFHFSQEYFFFHFSDSVNLHTSFTSKKNCFKWKGIKRWRIQNNSCSVSFDEMFYTKGFTPCINSLDELDLIKALLHLSIMNVLNLRFLLCVFSPFNESFMCICSLSFQIFIKTEKTEKCDVEDMLWQRMK